MEAGKRVLVVDDEPPVQKVLRRILERKGYQVFAAGDGLEALAVIDRDQPDLVLLDISMPRMDGIETLRKISQLKAKPVVIMITALGDVELAKLAISLGARDYLLKPFDIEYLEKSIDDLFRPERG